MLVNGVLSSKSFNRMLAVCCFGHQRRFFHLALSVVCFASVALTLVSLHRAPRGLKIAPNVMKVVVIAVTSEQTSSRIPELMTVWGNDFLRMPFSAGIFFDYIDWPGNTHPSIPKPERLLRLATRVPSDRKKVIECAIKEVAAAEYFLTHTNAGWLMRIVDDTFMNVPAFAELLGALPNPTGRRLLYGDCVDGDTPFVHGGSGYLMSRGMAAELVKHGDDWITNIIHRPSISTEEYFNEFLAKVGYTPSNASSPLFMGLFFDPSRREVTLYKCREHANWKHCGKSPTSIQRTALFHDAHHKMTQAKWKELVTSSSSNVMWLRDGMSDFLCLE